MRVRLQMGAATPVQRERPKNQKLASGAAALLAPFAALAGIFAIWRIAVDLGMASAFLFEAGVFSHWAVWGAMAVVLGWAAHRLNQYGGPPLPHGEVPREEMAAEGDSQPVEERR
jgi:hypothetical protein